MPFQCRCMRSSILTHRSEVAERRNSPALSQFVCFLSGGDGRWRISLRLETGGRSPRENGGGAAVAPVLVARPTFGSARAGSPKAACSKIVLRSAHRLEALSMSALIGRPPSYL